MTSPAERAQLTDLQDNTIIIDAADLERRLTNIETQLERMRTHLHHAQNRLEEFINLYVEDGSDPPEQAP